MTPTQSNRQSLDEHRAQLMHVIFRNLYLMILFGGTLSTIFSSWSYEIKYKIGLMIIVSFTLLLILSYWVHFSIKSVKVRMRLYLVMLIVTYGFLAFMPNDKFLASITPTLPALFLIAYFSYQFRNVLIFSGVITASLLFYFIKDPTPVIELSYGYYIIFIASIIITVDLFRRAIKMVRWYDEKLEEELDSTGERNRELQALNEEYYAAQEELHHNYDEILKLSNSEQLLIDKLDAILNVTEDGIIEYNITDNVYHFSAKAQKHLKLELIDDIESVIVKIHPQQRETFREGWLKIITGEAQTLSLDVTYDDRHYFNFTLIAYNSKEGTHYLLAAVKDITTLKDNEKRIFNLAYTDMLTGLNNRLGFLQSVDDYTINHSHFYMAIMDIDNFKFINNIFGYEVGDVILIEIASKLNDTSFVNLARTGDDKFAFIVPETLNLHEQIGSFIINHELNIHDQLSLNIKYSIGIAEYNGKLSASELLKRAEIAMYQVKQSGKSNYSFYSEKYTESVEKRLLISNRLERAVANEEIYMVYQPKYKINSREIVSFEALVRWESKKYGMIPPNIFIEIAEQSGFIKELSEFIITSACQFAKHINQQARHYVISINVSGKQLLDDQFASQFITLLEQEGIPPAYIGLEITETAVIEDLKLAVKELEKLHDYGITIYLDDFGTGYSSLNYLNQLPIDVIKIDKSFIEHIASDTHDLQLVRSIIQLARSLELKTVAEGVETEEQLKLLETYQCDIAQGYFFDKPLLPHQVIQRIQD